MSTETTFDLSRLPWKSRHLIREAIFKENCNLSLDLLEWDEAHKHREGYKEMKNWSQAQKELLIILQALSRD
jgi:hypothetical protein